MFWNYTNCVFNLSLVYLILQKKFNNTCVYSPKLIVYCKKRKNEISIRGGTILYHLIFLLLQTNFCLTIISSSKAECCSQKAKGDIYAFKRYRVDEQNQKVCRRLLYQREVFTEHNRYRKNSSYDRFLILPQEVSFSIVCFYWTCS